MATPVEVEVKFEEYAVRLLAFRRMQPPPLQPRRLHDGLPELPGGARRYLNVGFGIPLQRLSSKACPTLTNCCTSEAAKCNKPWSSPWSLRRPTHCPSSGPMPRSSGARLRDSAMSRRPTGIKSCANSCGSGRPRWQRQRPRLQPCAGAWPRTWPTLLGRGIPSWRARRWKAALAAEVAHGQEQGLVGGGGRAAPG